MLEDCACMDVTIQVVPRVVLEWYSTFLILNIEDPCGGPVMTPLACWKNNPQQLLGWASHHFAHGHLLLIVLVQKWEGTLRSSAPLDGYIGGKWHRDCLTSIQALSPKALKVCWHLGQHKAAWIQTSPPKNRLPLLSLSIHPKLRRSRDKHPTSVLYSGNV